LLQCSQGWLRARGIMIPQEEAKLVQLGRPAAIPAPDAAMIKELEDIRNSIVDLHEKRSAIETAPLHPSCSLLRKQRKSTRYSMPYVTQRNV
jgi:hypothetical protein